MNKIEEDNLIKTINNLAKEKEEKNKLEKSIKNASEFIKQKFEELEINNYATDSFEAYLRYTEKVDISEDMVIEILKENCKEEDLKNIIKTKEYIDFDALETFIYNGGIQAEKLEQAQSTKTIVSLCTKIVKKEQENE